MGCGKSKQAVATENIVTKSQSKRKEDDVVETTANENTTSPNALVEEKGESQKDEVVNKVAESKAVDGGEITKEEVEGGAKEEAKSENGVATNEKVTGDVGGSEKSKDVVEEKGLDEEAKMETTKEEDVAVETTTNENTTSPNAFVEEKGESKKDEVVNKVAESKAVDGGEITKEGVEGGAKEETKSENGVATNEKATGEVGGSEKSKDVVEEKGLDEEAKMETTEGVVGELVKEKEEKEEAAVPSIDTETPAAAPTAPGEEEKALVSNQEIVPTSPAEEPETN